jgi:23S rRNA (adenine2030-N6)-methyltransferase
MNYRHHFHAGNFADVFKHVLLLRLLRSLQRKDKGYLYLDTHAGRGGYDLSATVSRPDGSERDPEWPQGIGQVWSEADESLRDYLALVRRYNREKGGTEDAPQFYPGSPWFARAVARPQDRLALCELREDDAEALEFEFRRGGQTAVVSVMDGYTALRALLPPPERRALVLIDPPFEEASELADVFAGLREALQRFPSGVYAVWYPLSERARSEELRHQALMLPPATGLAGPPPALAAELQITGDTTRRLRGCGLLVVNPPWQIETEFRNALPALQRSLALDEGASLRLDWLVPDR